MTPDNFLSGQVAVITGGGRGIGREIARALALAGTRVAITARTREQLDESSALIRQQGGDCTPFVMDVTDAEQVKSVMAQIGEQVGPIDLLVNNAGVGGEGAQPWEVDADAWWRVLEVNVRGVFLCSQAVLPGMIERQTGRIINVGSNVAFGPAPLASAYSVSKAALLRLGENLAHAAGEFGVNVFTISPGLVLTDMTRDVPFFKDLPPEAWTPVERAGELCVYLASGAADKLNGRYIHASEDDVEELVARADTIIDEDLHTMRLQR
jgi:NAD(P)-dependent dehydrogenase (short-subunit alcohol dehydrogenase family)